MAKQSSSYMGGFSGRLGPAVGYRWKGMWCMRALPREVRNPRTAKQMEHREMFKEEVRQAARMADAVNLGLRPLADEADMTAHNMFVSLNQQAFSLDEGVFTVDYPALTLSAGTAAPVAFGTPTVDAEDTLSVTFEKNPQRLTTAGLYDYVYLYAYCPAVEKGFLAAPVHRRDRRVAVALPSMFEGHELHLYGIVCTRDGMPSDSAYIGSIVLQPTDEEADIASAPFVDETPAEVPVADAAPAVADTKPAVDEQRADPAQLSLW